MKVLAHLQPARVMHYFEEICAIPHGSGNTKPISNYCVGIAEKLGLACCQDDLNNVIIRKPGTPGYEDHPTVILQGHLDMVCEKEPSSDFDFATDGIRLLVEGDILTADGTTLGGDDGIAVAMVLAILEDKELPHPPLEALFTTDEETGMFGAIGLDVQQLKGRTLINIDSEEESTLTVGCAGGARANLTCPLNRVPVTAPCWQITVDGLIGGHSGCEIDKGRLNASVLMGQFLTTLPAGWQLISVAGGLKDNAIPRQCVCTVAAAADPTPLAQDFATTHRVDTDPDLSLTVAPAPDALTAADAASSARAAAFLATVPNGIQGMHPHLEGLVETSLNLGILTTEQDHITASFAVRSSDGAKKQALLDTLKDFAASFGGTYEDHSHYPAWEYRTESHLRDVMVDVYTRQKGHEPIVSVIHAGLECGLFSEKMPDLDAVSCGPDMWDAHTTRERISIASIQRTYAYVCAVLKAL